MCTLCFNYKTNVAIGLNVFFVDCKTRSKDWYHMVKDFLSFENQVKVFDYIHKFVHVCNSVFVDMKLVVMLPIFVL